MFCMQCGKENQDDARECWGCGAQLPRTNPPDSQPDVGDSGSTVVEEDLELGATLEPGTLVDGRYQVDRLLGQGGMGWVWLARDLKMEMPVAIKFLSPALWQSASARQRFLREARVCLELTHPGIVRLYHVGEWREQTYLALEYLEAQTLNEWLEKRRSTGRKPTWPEIADVLRQLAEAISQAHLMKVIHRDLKPANIMLARREGARPRVVVLDFGLAKAVGSDGPTRLGAAMGTPFYMAPEQAREGGMADHRADIYSIGAIGYELATGKVPLGRLAPIRRACPAMPGAVEQWILGALEPDPAARKVTLADLLKLVRGVAGGLQNEPAPVKHATPQPRPDGDKAVPSPSPSPSPGPTPKPARKSGSEWSGIGYLILICFLAYSYCHKAKQQIPTFKPLPSRPVPLWPTPNPAHNRLNGGRNLSLQPLSEQPADSGAARLGSYNLVHSEEAYSKGVKYQNGDGVAQNDTLAAQWYRTAAEAGNGKGMDSLGWMYQHGRGVPQNDALAVQWYRKAAEAGDSNAMNNLGWMYGNGRGIARDDDQAALWYRKAAEAGSASAMFNLGLMLESGRGVAQDRLLALEWYDKAAMQGQPGAAEKARRLRGTLIAKQPYAPLPGLVQ